MATTSPDNIWSPNGDDLVDYTVDLAAMATSVQNAISAVRGEIVTSGPYKIGTNAQRVALTGEDLFEGLRFWTTDTRVDWLYTAGTWVQSLPGQPFRMAAGNFTITSPITSDNFANYPVTFPAGRFTVPPIVTFGSTAVRASIAHTSLTATGMSVRVFNSTTGGSVVVGDVINWQAVQMASGSASG